MLKECKKVSTYMCGREKRKEKNTRRKIEKENIAQNKALWALTTTTI